MSLPAPLAAALADALGEAPGEAARVAGGSINDAWRVELASGPAFVKARAGATAADFAAEAAGLRWLADGGAPVPGVIAVGEEVPFLALEWVDPGALSAQGAEELGRALARLHRSGAPAHGALPPGSPDGVLRIGSVEVEPRERPSWATVYAEDVLLPLARRAVERGSLSAADARAVEEVCARLDELAGPPEPPARLHGDLWGGNVMGDAAGRGVLIDPAAYGGHREIDLAMLRLFGSPTERIFAAYAEEFPLADGHAERVALWQLLPLLVHAVLFGGGYGAQAGAAARRYL
ncbi:MAG TPA: fructosamine kinase family protein [Solirubrobacterales bacterium]